jgi:magnesium-transporting ATPase (P-type)
MKTLIALKQAIVKTAYAQDPIHLGPESGDFAVLENLTPASIVSGLIRLVLMIAAIVFFFMLVMGGIKWIMSEGDKTKLDTARQQITNALIGLVIIFVAWAIIVLVNQLFGIDLMGLDLPTLQP